MKRGFRKILSVILVLAMMCSLAACGSGGKDLDPNLGKYIGYQIDIMGWEPMDSVYDGGENYVELKSGGKGTFCLDGSSTKIKWTLDGEDLTMTAEGEDCTGTLKDGMITTDFFGYDFTMTFLKEGVEAPADTATTTETATTEAAEPETAGEVGYWKISSMDDGETTMNADELQEYDMVYYMQLEADGTGTMITDESVPLEWGDGKMTVTADDGESQEVEYTLDGDEITFSQEGMTMVFERGDESMMAAAAETSEETEDTDSSVAAGDYADYWAGDWYGWWIIESGKGDFEDETGFYEDCCATIETYDDNTGHIVAWGESDDEDTGFMTCDVSFGGGVTDAGTMLAESGEIWGGGIIEHADWSADPGAQMMTDYDHFITIHGEMEDPENDDNSYDYFLYLRPWGMDWEDIREGDTDEMPYTDMMPPHYDDWYMPLVESGETSAPVDIVLDGTDTGDSESDSESSTSATAGTFVDGVYDTGVFSVTVPDGWAAFGVDDMWSDEEGVMDPTSLMIGKGATDEYDIYSKPYIEIAYYDPDVEMYVPTKDMYDDAKDISPVTIGDYKWKGFTGSFSGYKLTLIYTGKADADQFQVTIWTETDGGKISIDDKDVQAIVGSITVD
jgi:hypothetical protein